MQISVDFGFGFLKALTDDNRQVIFPTAIGELQESTFQLSPNGTIGITTDDGSWLFGEDALLQSAMAGRWQSSDWILRPEYKAGILAAITETSQASRLEVELTLALPYQDARNYKDRVIGHLSGVHSVQRLGHSRQQIEITFPQKHPIVAQNIAPALRHLIKSNGSWQIPETTRSIVKVGVLNVGSHTIEMGTINIILPNNLKITHPQCITEPNGTYSLAKVIKPMFKEAFRGKKSKFSDHEIFDILRTDLVPIGPDDFPIPDNILRERQRYRETVAGLCSQNWADTSPVPLSDLYMFVVSGGGAHIVEPYLRSVNYHPNLVMSDTPQLDVVEGIRRLRRMLK